MMKHKDEINWRRFFLIGGVLMTVLFLLALALLAYLYPQGNVGLSLPSMGKKLAIVRIEGPIFRSEETVGQLEKCADSDKIKGVVLRVNSPGGGVVAAQEIYAAVARLSQAGKPVVVSMGSAGASGAYYIASAADCIVCNPGTITGSIGVLASFLQAEELLGKIGLGFKTIKSGEYKDLGAYNRVMTEREQRLFQSAVDDIFRQFLADILAGRGDKLRAYLADREKLKEEAVTDEMLLTYIKKYADGRMLTGSQARKLGFVDELGDFKRAVKIAGEKAGIKGEPSLIEMQRKRGVIEDFVGSAVKRVVLTALWEANLPTLFPGSIIGQNGGE